MPSLPLLRLALGLGVCVSALSILSLTLSEYRGSDETPAPMPSSDWSPSSRNQTTRENLVHVVKSRFMQHQPHLLSLGEARLQLFRTFCLPTMVNQSQGDYFWIIYIDPDLNSTLLAQLKDLVVPYQNIFVVKSLTESLNLKRLRMPLNISSILTGNLSLLEDVSRTIQDQILIETRLDADDGLHKDFLETIQAEVQRRFTEQPTFVIFCAKTALEWHDDLSDNGAHNRSAGTFVGVKDGICLNAGMTTAISPGLSQTMYFGRMKHTLLATKYPVCEEDENRTTGCIAFVDQWQPTAVIRSRTPTSAGMKRINIKSGKQRANQEAWWDMASSYFSIDRISVEATRLFFLRNLPEIALENLLGQCTSGHSCKKASDTALRQVLASVGRDDLLHSSKLGQVLKARRRELTK